MSRSSRAQSGAKTLAGEPTSNGLGLWGGEGKPKSFPCERTLAMQHQVRRHPIAIRAVLPFWEVLLWGGVVLCDRTS